MRQENLWTQAGGRTLLDAQNEVLAGRDEGIKCPCCGQFCKVYKRAINSQMAVWLIMLIKTWKLKGKHWVSVGDSPLVDYHRGGDYAKLLHWGLIKQRGNAPDSATKHSGQWKPTKAGWDFVKNGLTVHKYVHLYDNEVVGHSGPQIDIHDALGEKFDYRELMRR